MTSTSFGADTTVGQWVAARPETAVVFEQLDIDYCCGGKRPLRDVCGERALDTARVLAQLQAAERSREVPHAADWCNAPLSDLCDHIQATHHAYLRRELPRLAQLVAKVASVHGGGRPELQQVQQVFASLCGELGPHMLDEERILFPAVRQWEQAAGSEAATAGKLADTIRAMEQEHDRAGEALAQLRRLTADYQPPPSACNTYRVMLDGLAQLEADMHQHVHKENNILFPRAMALEPALAATASSPCGTGGG